MASSSGPLNEELQCSICLEVFTDPVTTPCSHNFCRTCLSKCWTDTQTCFCPLCKETFSRKPDLKINTTLREVAQHFKEKLNLGESEVFCDFCDEIKQKAVKSCLTCQSSYCESHLEPHLRVPRLKKHKLINAVENLEDYICQKHERPLELFCRDDQTYVCLSCTEGEHKTHNTVPIEEENREKKTLASNDCFLTSSRTGHISNGMIIGLGILMVAALVIFLILYIEITELEWINTKMKRRNTDLERRNNELELGITELKRTNIELKRRNTELEQLLYTDYHLQQLNEKLTQTGLKLAQKYAVDVTLDPDTANPYLILSDDGKQVSHGDIKRNVPENPKRFDERVCVLAKEGFSSGRFYYEVQGKGKTRWSLGVARESINRKEMILLRPENGFWMVFLMNKNKCFVFDDPLVSLSLRVKLETVGVFVDYEEGLVSFYNVESKSLIYSFSDQTFTDKLYPFFCLYLNDKGKNSNPLIISPVS